MGRILPSLFFLARVLSCRFFFRLSFLIQAGDGLLRVFRQAMVRVTVEEFLEGEAGVIAVVEIVFIYLANGEQGVKAVLAAGIFAAQELVLGDGLAQNPVIIETAAHLYQRFGHGNYA